MRKYICLLFLLFSLLPLTSHAHRVLFYGPTMANEHLWRIAMAVRPNNQVSLQQTMLAILRANPQAFWRDNVNGLKAGYHLRIPSPMYIQSISRQDAYFIVSRHNHVWSRNYAVNEQPIVHSRMVHNQSNNIHNIRDIHVFGSRPELMHTAKKITTDEPTKVTVKHRVDQAVASTSLSDLVKNKQAVVDAPKAPRLQDATKPAANDVAAATTTTTNATKITAVTTTNSTTTNTASLSQAQLDQINAFIKDTNNFKQTTQAHLNNIDNQYKTLKTQLTKLEQEFNSLTYHVIQIINNNTANSWGPYLSQLQNAFKKYGFNMLIAFLVLLLLLVTSLRLRRRARRLALANPNPRQASESTSRKDEYDFMGSHEAIPSKLDLARAYIDMGDYDNAKDALNEVLEAGNVQQKKEARDLLAKIPNLS